MEFEIPSIYLVADCLLGHKHLTSKTASTDTTYRSVYPRQRCQQMCHQWYYRSSGSVYRAVGLRVSLLGVGVNTKLSSSKKDCVDPLQSQYILHRKMCIFCIEVRVQSTTLVAFGSPQHLLRYNI